MNLAEQTRRIDNTKAEIVNQGISYQSVYGTSFAAAFMRTQGINIEIAKRVLSQPQARRK